MDTDLNAALAPLRWRGLNAAEAVGAAYQIDATPAIWAMKVDDPTWEAALETIEVAMKVCVLDMEGLPVTTEMRAAQELVLDLARAAEPTPVRYQGGVGSARRR